MYLLQIICNGQEGMVQEDMLLSNSKEDELTEDTKQQCVKDDKEQVLERKGKEFEQSNLYQWMFYFNNKMLQ